MTGTRRGWYHLASGAGLGRLFGFISNMLLSRWLGPTDLGLFNLVTTTVQTSDTLVRCGGDFALNFELGGESEPQNTKRGTELIASFSQLCTLSTIVVCSVVAIWVMLGDGLFPSSRLPLSRSYLTCLLLLMIASECISASAWEVLLVSHRTAVLALRQGLFFPLRLLSASIGALFAGVPGAMACWCAIAIFQSFWLKHVLGNLWNPLRIWPPLTNSVNKLLTRGLPFYISNLLSSMIFYPLLIQVASGSGLADVGYLRVGQILQQLFSFLPATLVPVMFLKLRSQSSFRDQVVIVEAPLRVIWLLLIQILLLYCIVDRSIIVLFFGEMYIPALQATRLLLLTSLYECLSQIIVQPVLADGQTRKYGIWQNGAAVISAVLGWIWIPSAGIVAYLVVRLLYVVIPLVGFGVPIIKRLQKPEKVYPLLFSSVVLLVLLLLPLLSDNAFSWMPYVFSLLFFLICILQRHDLSSFRYELGAMK